MKNKVLALTIFLIIFISICIIALPTSSAKNDTKKGKFIVISNETFSLDFEVEDGTFTYNWTINDFNNDSIFFYMEDENINHIHSVQGKIPYYANKTKVKSGKFTLNWRNRNLKRNIEVFYNITTPELIKSTAEGCYSTSIILPISMVSILFLGSGYVRKRRLR
jgi:hypothetical protein